MNVDALSRWYRWIEYAAFNRALEHARFEFLERLAKAERILVFGEGDGRALARLLEVAPSARVEVIELSGAMIDLARKRSVERVTFHQLDARGSDWPIGTFDGIVTHFFLDCFSEQELRILVPRIVNRMTPGARWLVTDFAIPDAGWRRWHAVAWINVMYFFFRITTGLQTRSLPPIGKVLSHAGLTRREAVIKRGGLIRSELWTKGR